MKLRVLLFSAMVLAASELPPPYATKSARNPPRVIAPPEGAKVSAPAGFTVDVWAEGFAVPRVMILGRNGEILLADSAGRGQGAVWVFPGGDPAKKRKLLTGLDRPYGLALWQNFLYVGEPDSVKRFPYDGARMTAGKGEEVVSLKGLGGGHWTRSLLFDRGGKRLYVGIGSESNVSPGEPPRRAAIVSYNPDGTGERIYASGTRNPTGLHWYPGTDVMWAAVQERDALGDDLVPDYFTHIEQDAFYGWPYAYIGPNPDPRNKGLRPDLVKKTARPDVLLGSHVAVMDFAFYTGNQFPAEYRGGAFLALHGSWNRSRRVGYSVAFVPFKNGKPAGEPRDFLTGWMLNPERKEVWGRPVGVLQLQDGSLLVSEDGNNRIYRVRRG